jgi:hypothetical protein
MPLKKDVSVLKKIAALSISFVGAAIGFNIIMLPFVIILNAVSIRSEIIGALISVVGFGLSIVSGVFIFKKTYNYFKKELQSI